MKFKKLKKMFLNHPDDFDYYLENITKDELYETYLELGNDLLSDDFDPYDLDIFMNINSIINSAIAHEWIEEQKEIRNDEYYIKVD